MQRWLMHSSAKYSPTSISWGILSQRSLPIHVRRLHLHLHLRPLLHLRRLLTMTATAMTMATMMTTETEITEITEIPETVMTTETEILENPRMAMTMAMTIMGTKSAEIQGTTSCLLLRLQHRQAEEEEVVAPVAQ